MGKQPKKKKKKNKKKKKVKPLPDECLSKTFTHGLLFDEELPFYALENVNKRLKPYYGIDNFDRVVDAKYMEENCQKWETYDTVFNTTFFYHMI